MLRKTYKKNRTSPLNALIEKHVGPLSSLSPVSETTVSCADNKSVNTRSLAAQVADTRAHARALYTRTHTNNFRDNFVQSSLSVDSLSVPDQPSDQHILDASQKKQLVKPDNKRKSDQSKDTP